VIRSDARFVDLLAQVQQIVAEHRGADADGTPLVTVSDVLGLVDDWTRALRQMLADPVVAEQVVARWGRLVDEAVLAVRQLELGDYYPDRRRVFAELQRLAADFDTARAARIGEALRAGWRNATLTVHGDVVNIDHVTDWVDLLNAMRRHFKEKRGTVDEPNPPAGGQKRNAPDTTVGEVLWVADFWTQRFGELAGRQLAKIDAAIAVWRVVVARATAIASTKATTDTYPENWAFWHALGDFVVAIDLAREDAVAPSWRLYLSATGYALQKVVEAGIGPGLEVAKATVHGAEVVAKEIANGAGEAFGGLLKPVLIGGAAVLGAVILVPMLTRRG
jgi:hypothetical protein